MNRLRKLLNRLKKHGLVYTLKYYLKTIIAFFKSAALNLFVSILRTLLSLLPLCDSIVFECENDMDDNPRAVYEYLLQQRWNEAHKLIWIVKDVDSCKKLFSQPNVLFLSRHDNGVGKRIILEYYLSRSRWFLFSHPYWFKKRRAGQVVIHINHGTPFKNRSKQDSVSLSEFFDFLVVPTEFTKHANQVFWSCPDEKVMICGFPRNDLLFSGRPEKVFTPIYNWSKTDKVIICLPTYKISKSHVDSTRVDPYSLDVVSSERDLMILNEKLKGKGTHLIIKPHPLQDMSHLSMTNLSNIHYIDNRLLLLNNILFYELLGCCDGLITDVSSVFFDYLCVDRPIGFLMNNVENYERGIIWPDYEKFMPGEKIYNLEDMVEYVENVVQGIDGYSQQRRELTQKFNGLDIHGNCSRFVEILFSFRSKDRPS